MQQQSDRQFTGSSVPTNPVGSFGSPWNGANYFPVFNLSQSPSFVPRQFPAMTRQGTTIDASLPSVNLQNARNFQQPIAYGGIVLPGMIPHYISGPALGQHLAPSLNLAGSFTPISPSQSGLFPTIPSSRIPISASSSELQDQLKQGKTTITLPITDKDASGRRRRQSGSHSVRELFAKHDRVSTTSTLLSSQPSHSQPPHSQAKQNQSNHHNQLPSASIQHPSDRILTTQQRYRAASARVRDAEYQPYGLADYHEMKQKDAMMRRGGLGPDYEDEKRKAAYEKYQRAHTYAEQVRANLYGGGFIR